MCSCLCSTTIRCCTGREVLNTGGERVVVALVQRAWLFEHVEHAVSRRRLVANR